MSIGADIKIRRVDKLNQIPEICKLSAKLTKEIAQCHRNVDFNYETCQDKGYFYSSDLILLISKHKEQGNWIGYYQYSYATTLTKIGSMVLGTGVCICGVYYFWTVAPAHVTSLVSYIAGNYIALQAGIIEFAGTLLLGAAYKSVFNHS